MPEFVTGDAYTPKTYEPTNRTLELEATTELPCVVPALASQMQQLGTAHGFDFPHKIECHVRVLFDGRVSQEDVQRLLRAVESELLGVSASASKGTDGGGDDD